MKLLLLSTSPKRLQKCQSVLLKAWSWCVRCQLQVGPWCGGRIRLRWSRTRGQQLSARGHNASSSSRRWHSKTKAATPAKQRMTEQHSKSKSEVRKCQEFQRERRIPFWVVSCIQRIISWSPWGERPQPLYSIFLSCFHNNILYTHFCIHEWLWPQKKNHRKEWKFLLLSQLAGVSAEKLPGENSVRPEQRDG